MPTPKMTGTRVEGSAKFGWIPGGGFAAGIVFNKASGMLSMSFGFILSVDMIVTNELSWHDKSDFRVKGYLSTSYILPWALRAHLHAAVCISTT